MDKILSNTIFGKGVFGIYGKPNIFRRVVISGYRGEVLWGVGVGGIFLGETC